MTFIRNPFDEKVVDSISNLIIPNLDDVYKTSDDTTKSCGFNYINDDWVLYTSAPYLKTVINKDTPIRKAKNHNNIIRNILPLETVKNVRCILESIYGEEYYIENTGNFLYLNSGYMEWHTNYDNIGDRIYITYCLEDNKSFFRYYDYESGKIITDYDNKGVTIRKFTVTGSEPYFWHSVASKCDRISLGFNIKPITKYSVKEQETSSMNLAEISSPVAYRMAIIKDEKVTKIMVGEKSDGSDLISYGFVADDELCVECPDTVDVGASYVNNEFILPEVPDLLSEDQYWSLLRKERNAELKESDWTQAIADNPLSTTKIEEWKTFRQSLRALPAEAVSQGVTPKELVDQLFTHSLWPTKPS